MKRQLIKQMRNEWRDNLWMVVALTVVTIAVWGLGVFLWANIHGILDSRGFDPENVYTFTTGWVPRSSDEYIDYGEGEAFDKGYNGDFRALLRALRESPNVEAAALHNNALPYNYNHNGSSVVLLDEPDSLGYYGNERIGSPDMARVLKFKSRTGKTPEQLAEILKNDPEAVFLSPLTPNSRKQNNPEKMLGKKVFIGGDSANVLRVADIIDGIVRSDFEGMRQTIYRVDEFDEETISWGSFAVRVKPGHGAAFEEEFRSTPAMRRHGNVSLTNMQKLTDKRDALQRSSYAQTRFMCSLILMLIAIVMLGLLGTFWFRVQQRTQEIAIRKVCGASSRQLFRRILSEAMLLLVGATVLAGALMWSIVLLSDIEIFTEFDTSWIIAGEAFTFVLMAIGIVVSIWWPARNAMKIEPALAIKDE